MAMTCSRLSSLRCGSCPAYSTPFTPHRIIRNLSLRPVSAASLPLRTLSTSARPAAASSTTAPSPEEPAILTWNEYLRLRKIKRRYNLGSSLIASLILGAGGVTVLASQNLETLQTYFFGLDPLIIMGAGTLGFGAAGWLMGPVLGGAVFGRVYVRWRSAMAEKEKNFFARIAKYRVDPTSSSMQNPVPDYYGEKITSVQSYRQWLKDQRAFNKKRKVFV